MDAKHPHAAAPVHKRSDPRLATEAEQELGWFKLNRGPNRKEMRKVVSQKKIGRREPFARCINFEVTETPNGGRFPFRKRYLNVTKGWRSVRVPQEMPA